MGRRRGPDNCVVVLSDSVSVAIAVAGGHTGKEPHQTPPVPDSTLNASILPKEADKEWNLVCVQWGRFPKLRGHRGLSLLTCYYRVRNGLSLLLRNKMTVSNCKKKKSLFLFLNIGFGLIHQDVKALRNSVISTQLILVSWRCTCLIFAYWVEYMITHQ